ncbi:hypothetical protein PIROE2DRAFT_9456, partial [Piromyces sp. E2]
MLTYEEKDKYLIGVEKDFNNYAKENDLDITFQREVFSTENITLNVVDYGGMVEAFLKKTTAQFDMFMVDAVYTRPSKTGIYKDKLVAVPLYIDNGALFSNKELLDKYKKKPPKTWDELIETAEDIMLQEKNEGNDDLVGYLGNFPKEETAMCSAMEFLYSYRENIDDKLPPEYLSKNALDALNKLKEIQDKVSS